MTFEPRLTRLLPLLLALGLGASCSKEQFAGSPKGDSFTADTVKVYQNQTCAGHTLVKPPVDILYLVDNSLSAQYLGSAVKSQIQNTIQSISGEFDYHVLVAPLMPLSGENLSFYPVLTNNAGALGGGVNVVSMENLTFFATPTGINSEAGFDRSVQLIQANRTNGVFRDGAHTLVVLVSNGDDTSTKSCFNGQCFSLNQTQFDARLAAFASLKSDLNALQFRFFSVVAHTQGCQSGYLQGASYRQMSGAVYTNLAPDATDQDSRQYPDSYDLCNNAYVSMYQGVNKSIRQLVEAHTYNYWPITSNTGASINENDIQVFKVLANGSQQAVPESITNGFEYVGPLTGQNTRVLPTPGEPKSGLFLRLHGSGQVTYPECLVVRTSSPIEYYGYVVAPSEPKPETIVVRVRGEDVPQGGPNGWSYEGYRENQNIKVDSSGNPASGAPLNKTGYFVKLHGSSIYASGDTVEIFYTPKPL